MYNLLISLLAALLAFVPIALIMGWAPALIPAILVLGVVYVLLARRVGQEVQNDMAEVVTLLQARQLEPAREKLEAVKARWSKWQFLIGGQIDAQIGMLDYMQMKWDAALPRLQSGQWRNWSALTAIGCIHWRKGDRAAAWKAFEKAAKASPEEVLVYVIWATLLQRADQRDEALKVVDRGLKAHPQGRVLKDLQAALANKKKLDPKSFPEAWYQFFPEDLAAQYMVRGQRSPPKGLPVAPGGVQAGFPPPKLSRKMRRGK